MDIYRDKLGNYLKYPKRPTCPPQSNTQALCAKENKFLIYNRMITRIYLLGLPLILLCVYVQAQPLL